MYKCLINTHFIKPVLHTQGADWLLPAIHQSILINGSKNTFERLESNYVFFHFFPYVMSDSKVDLEERVRMIGDCWNILFNPHLPTFSAISKWLYEKNIM